MQSRPFPMTCFLIAVSLSPAVGCASTTVVRPLLPPASDLRVAPKSALSAEALSSEAAL